MTTWCTNSALRTVQSLSVMVLLCALVLGQQTSEDSRSRIKFENRNQVDPKPLSIRALSGSVLDRDRVPIPQICLGLFMEEGHQFVASTVPTIPANTGSPHCLAAVIG